jgi:beta-glucosidase
MVVAVAALIASGEAAANTVIPCGHGGPPRWCNSALGPGKRAELLTGAMTRDEKIALLGGNRYANIMPGGRAHSHSGANAGVPRLGVPSVYLINGPAGVRQGYATALPAPLALAATWDRRLARRYGAVVGNEARYKGNDFVYGPTVNIMRTPLGGRTFEGYGEDPFLNATLTVPWIQGAQGQGVVAVVKHFAANNQEGYGGRSANRARPRTQKRAIAGAFTREGDRKLVNANVDQRTLHEVYLPQFEAAVKRADVGAFMCANNKVNGTYSCENRPLLTDVLRDQWGFRGMVLSDYAAAHDTLASLQGGLDFQPWPTDPGATYSKKALGETLVSGEATIADLDQHVYRILRTMFAHGIFDRRRYRNRTGRIDRRSHARIALRTEQAGITLLRNRGILPLSRRHLDSIAVIGAGARTIPVGGGSSRVRHPFMKSTPLGAIRHQLGRRVRIRYDSGRRRARAAVDARRSDVAIVFAPDFITEGVDRACLSLECPPLHGDQDALIRSVAKANKHTIVVLETGGPVLTPWRDRVKGLLEAWYPGERAGTAIARVLFGKKDPGGRLPATFPAREADTPTAGDPEKYPGVDNEETYKEGLLVGYRWYDALGLQPAYPFGFGLSYTTFRYHGLQVEPVQGDGPPVASARIEITNVGKRRGIAVPELYMSLPSRASVPEPPKQLKGFDRVSIPPGGTRSVRINLTNRDFSYWAAPAERWRILSGCHRVMVGSSSRDLPLGATIARGGADCGPDAIAVP